jgi:hypothetical protein
MEFNFENEVDEKFEILFQNEIVKVERLYVSNQVLFQVIFPNGKVGLLLTRATAQRGERFWTSIPEGRQKEAEEIGPLISQYILSKQ